MPPFMGPLANAMGQGFAQQRPQQMMRSQMPMQGQRPNIPRPMPRQLPPDMLPPQQAPQQGLGPSPNAPMMGRMAQGMGQIGAALGPGFGMQRPSMPPPPQMMQGQGGPVQPTDLEPRRQMMQRNQMMQGRGLGPRQY